MREQEVRELYEAYRQVHQPQEEVEQLDEEAPERITKPTKNKRLMKDAGPARVHNPNKVEEEVEKLDEAEVEKDPYTNPKTGKPHTYASRQAALKDKAKASPASTVKLADEFEPNIDEDAKYDRNRRRAAQRAAERNAARDRGQTGNVPGVGYVTPRRERETYRDSAGVERHTSGARMPKKEDQKESFDLFDIILEHLVTEGYADTNENALVIMANMSEEWRQDIVEAKYGTKEGRHKLAMKRVKGEEIGKSGPGTGFKAVEKKAKEYGAKDPAAVAAAAMYKTYGGKTRG